jgi:hypothetical protein
MQLEVTTSRSPLRDIITSAKKTLGLPLGDLTVLSESRDPFRVDTPAGHRDGQWLAECLHTVHDGSYRIHLRGLHYKLVGAVTRPDGRPYINDDPTWEWMSETVTKRARFLGHVGWDEIRDARNAPPEIWTPDFAKAEWRLAMGEVEVALPDNLEPRMELVGDLHRQPYRQIVIAEKAGVGPLLKPICRRRQATLCLPGGELSDQLLYDMLADADGRPCVIHQLGDFDPSGWQMAISTARTAQALVATEFPNLRVIVHHVGLTKQQCIDWDLPTTPLKKTEKRGTKWKAAWGREQTELDSAIVLRPAAFEQTLEKSLLQYYDRRLANRSAEVRRNLEEHANLRLADRFGPDALSRLREGAEEKLAELQHLTDQINGALRVDPDAVGVEIPEAPETLIGDATPTARPLVDTDGGWTEQTLRLAEWKRYEAE